MKIAIHAADLDSDRIDGTRVYIKNVLEKIGEISPSDDFLIYHKEEFNPLLRPKVFPNYYFFKKYFPFLWTQTRFAFEVWKKRPDVLWMPMHNLPIFKRKNLKVVVTIHDLAFKIYPHFFPKNDLRKLNILADISISKADGIIAISESTKNDIMKFYPETDEKKIRVIHHGFDRSLFQQEVQREEAEVLLESHKLKAKSYLLYVGAIQPRKNLKVLVDAFEKIKPQYPDLKLVIAGAKAWMWEETVERMEKSPFSDDIVMLGKIKFEDLPILYKNAKMFIFPELYAGFGIPLLEAFASGVPVISAKNSSLEEVGSDAVLYFDGKESADLAEKIIVLMEDESLKRKLIEKGAQRINDFSWSRCAKETLDFLKS